MTDDKFNYEDYTKSLEKILMMSEKDYWAQYVDINRHQVVVARTYLWVAAALLGAYAAIYLQYKDIISASGMIIITTSLVSTISAVIAFGLCLYAIPARHGYKGVPDVSWGEFSKLAHELLSEEKKNLYIIILTKLIDNVDKGFDHNLQTNNQRSKLLRRTFWILIISFLFSLISAVSLYCDTILLKSKQEVSMATDENNTQKPSEVTINQPTVVKPDVPAPAGPIGTSQTNYTTHAEKPSNLHIRTTDTESLPKGTIRVTEGLDKSE